MTTAGESADDVAAATVSAAPTPDSGEPDAPEPSAATTPDVVLPAPAKPNQLDPVRGANDLIKPRWVTMMSNATDIPEPAVRAYAVTALVVAKEAPRCRLSWTTLAALGAVESNHGRIGGRTLLPTGLSDKPVTGPPLNGIGYAAIPAKGDSIAPHQAKWDRAVGPMQFISSTWKRWAADGDGDGQADAFNIFDAALAAGRYVCDGNRDMSKPGAWGQAIFSYNHSDSYVWTVYDHAAKYVRATS